MDITSLQSTINKAREQFENGHAKACVETLKGVLGDLKVGEPEWYRLRNDTSFLLARLSGLERKLGMISEQNYIVEWNKLFHSTNQLILDFEAGVKEMRGKNEVEPPGLYPAELVLGLDFEKTDMEEIKGRILRIENILNTELGLTGRVTGLRAGSVIVGLNLYAEEIMKIRSLMKLGLVDDEVGFKVLGGAWDWIEGENFILQLGGLDLHKVDLRKLNLSVVSINEPVGKLNLIMNMIIRCLSRIIVEWLVVCLIVFVIVVVELIEGTIGALIKGLILILIGINYKKVRLFLTWLIDYLEIENIREIDQSRAEFSGAIFHVQYAKLLKKMKVDISQIIFVDDEGQKVESWIEEE